MPEIDADQTWRIKGTDRLDGKTLAFVRELWQWREEEALAANRPPYFILSHELLVGIARCAAHGGELDEIIPRQMPPRKRRGIHNAMRTASELPPSSYPDPYRPSFDRPSVAEQRAFVAIRKIRDARATELGIDPTIIASKGTLMALARDHEKAMRDLMSWQRELLAES